MNNGTTITDLTSMAVRHLNASSTPLPKELDSALTPLKRDPNLHFVKVPCTKCDGSGRLCAGSHTAEANVCCDGCSGRGYVEHTVRTNYDFPPIPIRSMDWSAWDDDRYDADYDYDAERYVSTSPVGHGATEQEAIADFVEQMSEQV